MSAKRITHLAVVGAALVTLPVQAQLLLTVDISNLSAVTVTAVGNNSAATVADVTGGASTILLQNILAGLPVLSGLSPLTVTSSDLAAASNPAVAYTTATRNNYSLQLTGTEGLGTAFTTGAKAFSTPSSLTVDMSGFSAYTFNTSGNIFSGAQVIGQYSVVPEPHEYAMAAGAALICFGLWRRRSGK